jgi:hypothetical protein
LRRELLDDASLSRNEDSVGQAQDFRQVGRYDDHRETLVGEGADQMMDLGDGADVHAARRLVENDQPGFLDQGLCDYHFLLIAPRKLDHARVAVQRLDAELLRPAGGERAGLIHARANPVRLGARDLSDVEIFRDRHRLEEAVALSVLGDIDDAAADRLARGPVARRPSVETDVPAMKEVALGDAGDDPGGFRSP